MVTKFQIPIDDVWLSFDINVVDADVPILIHIDYRDRIGVYFNNLTNRIYIPDQATKRRCSV